MVSTGIDGRQTIGSCWKSSSDIGGQDTVHSSGVQSLEELEGVGICNRCRIDRANSLDNNLHWTVSASAEG